MLQSLVYWEYYEIIRDFSSTKWLNFMTQNHNLPANLTPPNKFSFVLIHNLIIAIFFVNVFYINKIPLFYNKMDVPGTSFESSPMKFISAMMSTLPLLFLLQVFLLTFFLDIFSCKTVELYKIIFLFFNICFK